MRKVFEALVSLLFQLDRWEKVKRPASNKQIAAKGIAP